MLQGPQKISEFLVFLRGVDNTRVVNKCVDELVELLVVVGRSYDPGLCNCLVRQYHAVCLGDPT